MSPTLAFLAIPAWCGMCALVVIPLTRYYVRMLIAVSRRSGMLRRVLWISLAFAMLTVMMIPVTIAFAIAIDKRSENTLVPLVLWALVCLVAMFTPCYRIMHVRNASALRETGFLK
jgi:hypothetical protein